MGKTTVHAKARLIEARMLLGSVWHDKKKANVVAIVKIEREHPDPARVDDLIVLVLDLLTGETKELVFNTKKDEFEWISLRRL